MKQKEPRRTPTRSDALETREKLLIQAGMAFAEHGFEGANLRAICESANVNLGAIKYYFGNKKELYREALIEPHIELMKEESLPEFDEAPTPEAALKNWIKFFMRTVLVSRRKHPYLSRLMIRELVSPSFALDELIQTVFMDMRTRLITIISKLTSYNQDEYRVGELANMTVLLCLQQEMGRGVFERIGYPPPTSEEDVMALAERIYLFALSGIKTWS